MKRIFILIISLHILFVTPLFADNKIISSVSFEFKDGLDLRIIKAISKKLNFNVDFKFAPFARRLVFMKNAQIDIMAGLLKRKDREEYIYYIEPPYKEKSNKVFFVLKGKKALISKYKDLYKLTIGTKIESKYFLKFDNDKNIKKSAVSKAEQNFKMLLLGRVDAVIFSKYSGLAFLDKIGFLDKVEIANYSYEKYNPVYVGVSRESILMSKIDEIENIVKYMVENGEVEVIINNYFLDKGILLSSYE